jgi:hypothetical protein
MKRKGKLGTLAWALPSPPLCAMYSPVKSLPDEGYCRGREGGQCRETAPTDSKHPLPRHRDHLVESCKVQKWGVAANSKFLPVKPELYAPDTTALDGSGLRWKETGRRPAARIVTEPGEVVC